MNRLRHAVAAAAVVTVGFAAPANAAVEFQLWHAMGGALGQWVDDLAKGYNDSQADYRITPVFKGNYTETMTGAIAAFRAGEQPAIVQVFEVGTATMMAARGAVYPVHQLMAETGTPFNPAEYLPAVTGYYTTADGLMLSMPFNSSTPVMYYNKDAFLAAGLDPEVAPKTWPEFAETARKLVAGGAKCGFTTAWQDWIHIENFSAWHNLPIGTLANGFAGLGTELTVNSPAHVAHITAMKGWLDEGLFKYGGRRGDSQALFTSGECAMFFNSSAGYAGIKGTAKFNFGIAMLPYWPEIAGAPQNSIIGGATLWVLQGRPAEEYKGVAGFFNYINSPAVQAASHQRTGYLPITTAAYELTKQQGYYDRNPGTETSILQLNFKVPTENSKGLRFGNYVQVRDIINEELEAVWGGQKTPKDALDALVSRGNTLIRQFEADNAMN